MRTRLHRLFKLLLLGCLALPVLLLVFLWTEHLRGSHALAKYKRQLKAANIPVSIDDFLRPPLPGKNGASELMAAAYKLKPGKVAGNFDPVAMAFTPKGTAIVSFQQHSWQYAPNTNHNWSQIEAELRTNSEALKSIRRALEAPVIDHNLDYAVGPMLLLPHLAPCKQASQWLSVQARLALHENHLQDAHESLTAMIQMPRSLEHDAIVISELVRIALAAIARAPTWEALQADGWDDSQLAQIQAAWEKQHFMPGMARAIQYEGVFSSITFDLCRASNSMASMVLNGGFGMRQVEPTGMEAAVRQLPYGDETADFYREAIWPRLWRFAWLDQCERMWMERVIAVGAVASRAQTNRSLKLAQAELAPILVACTNASFYDRIRFVNEVFEVSTLARLVERAAKLETERSLILAAIALKRHALTGAPPPTNLQALVPQYLSSIPIDYMDGQPLRYTVLPGRKWLLYSIGTDFTDDQGDTSKPDPTGNNDWWRRKDVVWPAPATEEEIVQFNTNQTQARIRWLPRP